MLPEAYHVDHFEKAMKRVKELAEKLNPGSTSSQAKGPADIKMPTMKVKDEVKESENSN